MSEQWYYTTGGERNGPVSWDALKAFATQKKLAGGDLVWNEGMSEWVEARTVAGLMPAKGPPPLPPPADEKIVEGQAWGEIVMEPFTGPFAGAGSDKVQFYCDGVSLGVGSLREGFRGRFIYILQTGVHTFKIGPPKAGLIQKLLRLLGLLDEPNVPERVYRLVLREPGRYSVGFRFEEPRADLDYPVELVPVKVADAGPGLGTRLLEGWAAMNESSRRSKLNALWQQVGGHGMWFLFTKDGAMLRQDGLATKVRWLDNETLELYEDGGGATVKLQVLSLSDSELVVKTGGQSGHFFRSPTITQAVERQRRKEAEQAIKDFTIGAAKVAGGVAAVLAVGGVAVLCGVAGTVAVLGGDGGGGGSGSDPTATPGKKPAALPPASASKPAEAAPARRAEAVALKGAVVVGYEGSRVVIQHKCEGCGTVQPGQTVMGFSTAITSGGFTCHRCHAQQEYAIKGTS